MSAALAALLLTGPAAIAATPGVPPVVINDNRHSAGHMHNGHWRITLRAARGQWRPQGDDDKPLLVEAFGADEAPLTVPAPLVRVRSGLALIVTVRNDLDAPLLVHGLCGRGGAACPPLDVPAGESRELRFIAGTPGTYHYWATTTKMPLFFRGAADSQLSGAFIIDPADGAPPPDRVFVITEWVGLTHAQLLDLMAHPDPGAAFLRLRPPLLFTINGRAWPHTERLSHDVGDTVRWRIVNLSTQAHPMHLHGFYFDVTAQGDGQTDRRTLGAGLRAVTHQMPSGSTLDMTWTPERAGHWLFHCHTMLHVSPTLHVDGTPKSTEAHDHHRDAGMGMTGLVMGIQVRGANTITATASAPPPPRQLTLAIRHEPRRFGDDPALGFALADGAQSPPVSTLRIPGPPLVLRRGEPVEITLVNELQESTSIHWHGMELESYYDGVHGWSGTPQQLTPAVAPGGTFVVRITAPRAGTFIYHTHLHDNRQLTSGLYGALIVVEPGEQFDEEIDHVFVVGRGGPALDAPVVVNGERTPQTVWKAGRRHRIRLINITPNDTVVAVLRAGANPEPATWRQVAKDGASLAPDRLQDSPASQTIGVGETFDFEFDAPRGRQTLWLELRSPGGRWLAQAQVIVHPAQ